MNVKMAGVIALVVIALAGVAWSFKNNFMNGAASPTADQAAKMRDSQIKMREDSLRREREGSGGQTGRPGVPGGGQHSK